MSQPSRPRGFTLIELMVTIGVAAILMLIALPTTMDKLVREQVDEALPLAEVVKAPVELAWRTGLPLPADNAAAGLPPPEKIVNRVVQSVRLDGGTIQITFGNSALRLLQGKVLTVRAAGVSDARIVPLTWLCAAAAVPGNMQAQGENRTTVPAPYLPVRCR
jgi:type IV pilus assembly protein PilA